MFDLCYQVFNLENTFTSFSAKQSFGESSFKLWEIDVRQPLYGPSQISAVLYIVCRGNCVRVCCTTVYTKSP